jgi:hypothetical protein
VTHEVEEQLFGFGRCPGITLEMDASQRDGERATARTVKVPRCVLVSASSAVQ